MTGSFMPKHHRQDSARFLNLKALLKEDMCVNVFLSTCTKKASLNQIAGNRKSLLFLNAY